MNFGDGVPALEGGGGERALSSSEDGGCASVTDQSEAVLVAEEGDQPNKLLQAGSCESDWQDWEADKGGRGSSQRVKLPRPEGGVNCPRCGSDDTKFCYYNNYNIKQPRYFCKTCQRYWTVGGTLRNVPIGSGRRKSKTGGGKELEKGGFGTLDPQQSFGVYNNFRNVLDPLFAYGGMVNAGKAHAIGAAFNFPCPSVDSLSSNIVKREVPVCSQIHAKKPRDEVDSQELGCTEVEKGDVDNVGARSESLKSEDLVDDGSVDGRRVKMKMCTNNSGRSMGGIGVSSCSTRYVDSSTEGKESFLLGTSAMEADWYTASAIAAMNQQMAAVMAAASSLSSNPGNSSLASQSGGSTQTAIDYSALSQQAQSFHAAHLHAQAAQVTQAQLHAHMQAQAQNQAQPQHVQVHNQLHAQEQAVQATQVALRMQAAQAMSQVAMSGWGQAQIPYWPGMWNPYGQWAGAQVRNQWSQLGQGTAPSGSGGSGKISVDMPSEHGSMPPENMLAMESASSFLPPASPQPTLPGSLNPPTQRVLYNDVEENHPSQNMDSSRPCQNPTADQASSVSQSVVMPACALMGVNPWMQLPSLAALGWGTGGCSPNVPNPFGGWMGGTSVSPFPPQFPPHIYGLQTSSFSSISQEANGLSFGSNNGNKSGIVSGADFSSRKESQVQDSSVF